MKEADDHGDNHHGVDDGVRDVVGQDGEEPQLVLIDQGKVQDENDGRRHQTKQADKQSE